MQVGQNPFSRIKTLVLHCFFSYGATTYPTSSVNWMYGTSSTLSSFMNYSDSSSSFKPLYFFVLKYDIAFFSFAACSISSNMKSWSLGSSFLHVHFPCNAWCWVLDYILLQARNGSIAVKQHYTEPEAVKEGSRSVATHVLSHILGHLQRNRHFLMQLGRRKRRNIGWWAI